MGEANNTTTHNTMIMNVFASSNDNHETGDCLPDACGNDVREEKLIERQQRGDGRSLFERAIDRDRNLIIACAILIVLMNISTGRYVLYPFKIFSTWVHEMCHGLAALLMGGRIAKLQIFKDGSGLAYTSVNRTWQGGFVASGGYPGTAITGCILLLFRRTTLGPTIGTIGLGLALLLSCALYVRNIFGVIMLSAEGVFLLVAAWQLPAVWLDNLYNFLAVTCCLNAFETIQDLFSASQGYVNGQQMSSDAHTVAEIWGLHYLFWATLWLLMSFAATFIGIVCARDARELSRNKKTARFDAPTSQGSSSTPQYMAYTI
jgi:Peptidase M50B-like